MATYRKVYAYKGIEVSETGSVRRAYNNKGSVLGIPTYHTLSFKQDKNGNRIVSTKDYGDLRVDKLVALAFRGNPRGRQKHVIHKDRVKEHCWKDNLKWANTYEYGMFYINDPIVNTPDGFRFVTNNVYVNREGEIKIDGIVVKSVDYLYDPDLDSHRAIDLSFDCPYINSYGTIQTRRAKVEDLVAEAFIPYPTDLSSPVVIHKDGDYFNCNASNLEWVEQNSQSCRAYYEQRFRAFGIRNKELEKNFNGH